MKRKLFQLGLQALEQSGWTVQREKGIGKSSVRRISKNGDSKLVSIRTTQDRWIAFPAKPNGKGWFTLDDVDAVVAVSFSPESRDEVWAHQIPATEIRERFDRAYKARKEAGRHLPKGRRGIWIPLYAQEADNKNVSYVGGGAGLDHKPIARFPLNGGTRGAGTTESGNSSAPKDGLTIASAKRGLALTYGVAESSIKIIIEG
jgi:hypothetical protein